MGKKEALQEIYNNLMAGKRYARWFDFGVKYPFWDVKLYRHYQYFCWNNYGSSANSATKKDLAWIVEVIFKMTPQKFIETYTVID